jgi:ribosomal protein L32/copper chaperone CopZ
LDDTVPTVRRERFVHNPNTMTFNPDRSRSRSGSGGSGSGCCDNKACGEEEKKMTKQVPVPAEEEKPSCEKGCCGGDNAPPASVEESCCSSSDKKIAGTTQTPSSCCTAPPVTIQHELQQQVQQQHMDDDIDLDSPLCLAVIREDGGDVVLFDASGRPRSFNFKGDDIRKLCFDTHSYGTSLATGVDDLLTPCFDQDGNHGDPEESCFCGVDTPHLHAHLRDPRTCQEEDDHDHDNDSKKKAAKSKMQDNISYLASQTLHPIDPDEASEEIPLVNIDVSDSLPKACNEKSSSSHDMGNQKNQKDNARHQVHSNHRRRMHKVRHDDHVDYLVHNPSTGELHLEHPSCNDCGQDDVHGKFRSVGKRQLQRDQAGGSAVKGAKQHRSIRIQFFEVVPRIATILDAFELSSGRVAAVEHILDSTLTPDQRRTKTDASRPDFWGIPPKEPSSFHKVVVDAHAHGSGGSTAATTPQKNQKGKVSTPFLTPDLLDASRHVDKKTVRSTLACSRICCAAETPMISAITDKLVGVHKVMINVPLKQVIVDHFPLQISAEDIAAALNKNHFGASIKRDGGASVMTPTAADMAALPTKGRSHFFVQHICCASEIPAINSIVEPMQGVSAVSINVTTKTVYVDHDTGFVSALEICEALNQEGFGAQIRHDFSAAAASARSMFVRSTLTFEHEPTAADPDTQSLTVFLRTFDASQLESFVVDVPAKTITVVHNPLGLSAQTIADQLFEPVGINATVLVDGADTKMWDIPTLDEDSSMDGMEGDEPMTYPSPAVTLSGIFWIVSMLSFIGGNW